MPSVLTYPGVYIEEIPSGVRTITGVSTSVTAFAGTAKRGPIDRAVRILSFADFERTFGGLVADSELGYAVRQFYQNGGSEAFVIRLAKNAGAAVAELVDGAARPVLRLTARDVGAAGNNVEVRVDHDTGNPASTFNLTLVYTSSNAAENRSESFADLSMNRNEPRYAVDVLNDGSALVQAERLVDAATVLAAVRGTSRSGDLTDAGGLLVDVTTLVDAAHNRLQVSLNGEPPVEVVVNPNALAGLASNQDRIDALCAAITTQVAAVHAGFTCAPDPASPNSVRLLLTSHAAGEGSSVRVLPGSSNDASVRLKLGAAGGGVETDAVAQVRPVAVPTGATLTGIVVTNSDLTGTPAAGNNSIRIGLDGAVPELLTLTYDLTGAGTLGPRLTRIAANLEQRVRAMRPGSPAYAGFTATVSGGNRLVLTSGGRGAGSSVEVGAGDAGTLAAALGLTGAGVVSTLPTNRMLTGGTEQTFNDSDPGFYGFYIGDRATRKGIYALDSVDLFNLMVLPGVGNPGVLADAAAYCRERRAFLIVDAPRSATTPDAISALVQGPTLPKTDRAAIYFPWIEIADPLKGGRPRPTPPSGTIAGLYARIDSTRGIWKAPAGTEATLNGVQGVVGQPLTDGENGVINPRGINAIRVFPGIGPVAWGARTLRGDDKLADEWKYIPVRRLALYIEESLYRGTQWVVFEPNDEPLWAQIRLNLGAFMNNLFRQGAFQGKTPAQAYLVKCDSETTTQNDIDLGIVNILVAFAPLKPAEFVVIRIQQKAGQIAV
jgi:hypothetical protein